MVQIVLGLIALASFVVQWMRDKQALDQAGADLIAQRLKAALDEVQKSTQIRETVRADIAARPDSVRDVDPFSRD